MPKLICISGMNKGLEYPIQEGEMTIGRSDKNSIPCLDTKASRIHCKIYYTGEKIIVEDQQSTNGTRINNSFLTEPRYLVNGDHIQIGQTIYLVQAPNTPAQVFEPVNMPEESVFVFTHTTSVRKSLMTANNPERGYISYAVAHHR